MLSDLVSVDFALFLFSKVHFHQQRYRKALVEHGAGHHNVGHGDDDVLAMKI